MVNNESDSESECFESAEESLEEEEDEIERKSRLKEVPRKSESEMAEPVVLRNDRENETVFVEDSSVNLSYRKRPERIKRTSSTITQKVNSRSKKSPETVFKTDVADVFFQDITSNLSKNINKSLNSLQQTSSNVKDLILSSLPSPSSCEEGFVYDESLDISPIDENASSNETLDDKTDFTDDNIKKSPNFELVQNDEAVQFNSPDMQNNANEAFVFKKESLEINSENSLINNSFAPISDSKSKHKQNSESSEIIGSKELESDINITSKHDSKLETPIKENQESQLPKASEINIENISEDQVKEDSVGNFAKNISSQNNSDVKEPESEEQKKNEEDSCLSNKTVPPPLATKIDSNTNVIDSLQTQNISDNSFTGEEFNLDTTNEEGKLNVDFKNLCIENRENLIKGANAESDKDANTVDKNDAVHLNSKVGCNKIEEEKNSKDVKVSTAELKTDNEIILQQTEVNDEIKTSEVEPLEINSDIKECNSKSNEIDSGWDDFDFSDNENEGFNTEDLNKDAKLSESKDAKDTIGKKHNLPEEFDSAKINMNIATQKTNAGSSEKYLEAEKVIDEQCKEKKTSEKKGFDDDWEWENWDDEADEKEGESMHKTTVKDYDKPDNIPDDGSKWSGWDNFSQRIEEKQGNWNLGTWGVNLLLNKATAVTQGISNVLEAGLGAPDPETLARMQKEEEKQLMQEMEKLKADEQPEEIPKKNSLPGVNLFPVSGITNLVAGVTSKIVERTKIQEIGSKVLTGGLDTLETFGKKTMEVLQDGDPGLRNKRALLAGNNKPVLSQILREAREKADKEIKQAEEKALAKKCHFETLFDDFQGMVHLEALEMLSRQYELKIEQLRCGMTSEELEDLEGVLEEVEQLCALDDFDVNSVLDFKTALQMAVEPLKEEISVKKIIEIHDSANKWLQTVSELDPSETSLHQKAVSTVAELTAATVHQFLKAGELLSVKECRKTVDEIDALSKLTNILCMEINKICEKFILMARSKSKKELPNDISEKVIVVRNNSTSYIKQAFNLLIPVLQAGAAL